MKNSAAIIDKRSFFESVDEKSRQVNLEAYLNHLTSRNGELDKTTDRFSLREVSLENMDKSDVRSSVKINQQDFERLYAHFNPSDASLTPEMLVLLTYCKMNAGEAYGVRVVKAVHANRHEDEGLSGQAIIFAQSEEEYHTRILVGAARHFDILVEGAYNPKLALRILINSLAYAPKFMFHPILFGAEVAGIYVFNWVLNQVGKLIKGQPILVETLERRLIEVLVDELGHVALNRLILSENGRRIGRSLSRFTARGLPFMTPELQALGFDGSVKRKFDTFDLPELPLEVRTRGFFA